MKKISWQFGLFIVSTFLAFSAHSENINKLQNNSMLSTEYAITNPDPFKQLREEVADVAATALPTYLAKVTKERVSDFGFQSPEELTKAKLLPPIPLFMPIRKTDLFNRSGIEKSLGERPITWIVPISVGDSIACLIYVDSIERKKPEAGKFGDNYRAKRIESGLRLFGWPNFSYWQDLRFLSFYEPNLDLLLIKESGNQWKWLNLENTLTALHSNEINKLLEKIKNVKLK